MESGAVVATPTVARPFLLSAFRALRLPPQRVGDPTTVRQLNRAAHGVGLGPWRERTRAVQDSTPALYLHEYTSGGLTVRGLVGALDVSRPARCLDDRAVLPHEGIRPAQADDLADRMQQLSINPAPILLVHRAGPAAQATLHDVRRRPPDHRFDDRRGQQHQLWAITDPAAIQTLADGLRDVQALIADGHHRYAAYLRMQRRAPGGGADHGLVMLVDQGDTPLFLGPIHRVLTGVDLADIDAVARRTGHRVELASRAVAIGRMGPSTMAITDGERWGVLVLQQSVSDRPRRLAVQTLHDDLLPAMPIGPHAVDYAHDVEDAIRAARRGRRIAVLMPAPDVDGVIRSATGGALLPHKATSFQPKPDVGVLIRSLHDG